MDQYDENNESTPVHIACSENNVEILKLLLQQGANVNALHKPNNTKYTTMHIAAIKQNVRMMQLLIQHGFDCDKFINNIYYYDSHKSVFLELCARGNVECLDYLMNQCENIIDIWQRDINGFNGLHIAVGEQHVSMVKYLLCKVYKNEEMKQKVFNQPVGINDKHISLVAAENGTINDGLSIFKLLIENKCETDPLTIIYAASHSSLILDYMLNEELYLNKMYLANDLIDLTLVNAHIHLIHKHILIIVKYLSNYNMKHKVPTLEYKQWIIHIFYNIMMRGTMDGYLLMFKEVIQILLEQNDWKCFTKSGTIIDKPVLIAIEKKMNDPTNIKDICDDKWNLFLKRMIDSFDDETLLNDYDDLDCKTNEQNDNDVYYCNKNHLMTKMNDNYSDSSSDKKCICCNEFYDVLYISFECSKCEECICKQCINHVIKLIQMLENEMFDQFQKTLEQYQKVQQKYMIKAVE